MLYVHTYVRTYHSELKCMCTFLHGANVVHGVLTTVDKCFDAYCSTVDNNCLSESYKCIVVCQLHFNSVTLFLTHTVHVEE